MRMQNGPCLSSEDLTWPKREAYRALYGSRQGCKKSGRFVLPAGSAEACRVMVALSSRPSSPPGSMDWR